VVGAHARLPLLLALQAVALALVHGRSNVVMLAVVLLGAANGLSTLERGIVIAEAFGTERYATVSGRIATFANASRAAAPVAVGLVKTAASSYAFAFLGLAAMSALAAVIAWVVPWAKVTDRRSDSLRPSADDDVFDGA
jgi:hypothetical protein